MREPVRGHRLRWINGYSLHESTDATPERRFQVWTRDGQCLEEFGSLVAAVKWCEEN